MRNNSQLEPYDEQLQTTSVLDQHQFLKSFSTGYLSRFPYKTDNIEKISVLLAKHLCPCCHNKVDISITQVADKEREPAFYSALGRCGCNFDVPFYVTIANATSSNTLPAAENKAEETSNGKLGSFETPDIESTESLNFYCRYLLHLGHNKKVIRLINALNTKYPFQPLFSFYKAFAYEKMGDLLTALSHYDSCLDMDNECSEAWHNKAIILSKLSRFEEANYHLIRYYRLCDPKKLKKEMALQKSLKNELILCNRQGTYGTINVIENSSMRLLKINQETEGGFWLINKALGTVPANDYVMGFLPAGCHFDANNNHTNGLMLGLGAGAGVIALLENFNKLQLTVVEIDQALIAISLKYFPKLNEFISSNRLQIICQDAFEFIQKPEKEYDFTLVDLYKGEAAPNDSITQTSFVSALAKSASLIGINLFKPPSWSNYQQFLKAMKNNGLKLSTCFPTGTRGYEDVPYQNRVVYSKKFENLLEFIPYMSEEFHFLHRSYRRDFTNMVMRSESIYP